MSTMKEGFYPGYFYLSMFVLFACCFVRACLHGRRKSRDLNGTDRCPGYLSGCLVSMETEENIFHVALEHAQ